MQTNSSRSKRASKLQPNSAITKFANGPQVAIQVEIADGAIVSSCLTLSDSFLCIGGEGFLIEWLSLYVQGAALPFPFFAGTPFQKEVMQALSQIPFGQTKTYGEVAHLTGRPQAARAIGGACGQNPFPLFIPCHRVVQANGKLGGFSSGLEIKRRLLEFEAGVVLPR